MSNTLSLATRLRSFDDEALRSVLSRRAIIPTPIHDFFDLAAAFLDRTNIQRALAHLDRSCLLALLTVAELSHSAIDTPETTAPTPSLRETAHSLGCTVAEVQHMLQPAADLLLIHLVSDAPDAPDAVVLYDAVRDQIDSWPVFGLPNLQTLASAPQPAAPIAVTEAEVQACDRLATEYAFAATTAITELLLELEREPARELAKGGVALPDKKRLANALAVDLDTVVTFLTVAEHAGLAGRESSTYLPTLAGSEWLTSPTAVRWQQLATGWLAHLHPAIRHCLADYAHDRWGAPLHSRIAWRYPAGGEWLAQGAAHMERDAELLGVIAHSTPSSFGSALLTSGPEAAAASLRPLLPPEVSKVYLQNDLSIVAPGPLTPEVDARLRLLATAENRALAATYRVSASSINRALAAGGTAAEMLEFLASVSLTGVPQPLTYLITDCAARYGAARVHHDPDGGVDARTRIRSEDTNLLGTMMVDQTLSALALHRPDAHTLTSRHPLDTVFWSLSDARYPVAAEDGEGRILPLSRRRVARAPETLHSDPVTALLERLKAGSAQSAEDDDREWIAKQVDTAIRAKLPLIVTVSMPGGATAEYRLEPVGISGGRVRALDRHSDIERTLPLTSIAAVRPA